jgi:NADPH-dependent F420 reductase
MVRMKIAILGGTGKEGMGIGFRWAKAGHDITIGSRQEDKALDAASKLQEMVGKEFIIHGKENLEAAKEAELLVLTVPYSAHKAMCEYIKEESQGKIVIDVTVPLVPPKVTKVQMPPEGSATLEAKEIFGENTSVVAAFQNISYEHLIEDGEVACDVLVTGDSKSSRETVIKLIQEAGLVAIDAGPIENSVVVEGLTSILIGINKQFGVKDAGIKITGIS